MPHVSEEENIRARVRAYLDGAVITRDGRSLKVRDVIKFVPCSPTTFYKYGLEKDVERTERALKDDPTGGEQSEKEAALEARALAAEAKVVDLEQKYNEVLGKLIHIEYHLRGNPAVDLDKIYSTPIPPPDRSSPYQTYRDRPNI